MPSKSHLERYGGTAPENYERFFVPVIGAPLAADLVELAELRPDERVLDVACGTGVVSRLARAVVGDGGRVAGLDPNPGMLGVARSVTPAESGIEWHQASAEAMPLPDEAFDAVLCQMGLQFVPDKPAALREMRRVLAPGGRLVMNVVGPAPAPFGVLGEALVRHVSPEARGFVDVVFSLYDPAEIEGLLEDGGFRGWTIRPTTKCLRLPPPEEFLGQYIHSTPLAPLVMQVDEEHRKALEEEVVSTWRDELKDGAMRLKVGIIEITARK